MMPGLYRASRRSSPVVRGWYGGEPGRKSPGRFRMSTATPPIAAYYLCISEPYACHRAALRGSILSPRSKRDLRSTYQTSAPVSNDTGV